MKGNKIKPAVFNGLLYIITGFIVVNCVMSGRHPAASQLGLFILLLIGCMLMGLMAVNSGKNHIELTDAIVALTFFAYGRETATFFTIIYWTAIGIINNKVYYRDKSTIRIIYDVCMMTVAAYTTSSIINYFMINVSDNLIFSSFGFTGVFLIINIAMVKINFTIRAGKYYKFNNETSRLLLMNFIVSSMVVITLNTVYKSGQTIEVFIVLCIMILFHYSFFIFIKLNARNEAIKRLLKITGDMVKHGEFRDKCNHLIINLRELIPYNVCALYTFDMDNDSTIYPVSYYTPEGMGIGDLFFDLSSESVTARTVREGKIYMSKDVNKDKKIRVMGKLLEVSKSLILVPISIEDRIVGIITIAGGQDLTEFMGNGIDDILLILSNQVALAIENDRIYRDIKNKADMDHLTGLFNRRAFDKEIDELIESRTPFSMVIYDIDDFKSVNDTYGHLVGDEVLKSTCDIIKKAIRKTDIPCRFGGEEIVIIFKDLSKNDAYIISDRIRNKIESTKIKWQDDQISITVSGGVSSFPLDGQSRDEIIRRADDVLYNECKRRGKNKVCAYNFEYERNLKTANY